MKTPYMWKGLTALGLMGRELLAVWGRQWKEPLVGSQTGDRSWDVSQEKLGSDWPSLPNPQLEAIGVQG